MEQNDKIRFLLDMHEHPENYSDEQLARLLDDEQMAVLWQRLATAKRALTDAPEPDVEAEWQRLAQSQRPRAAIIPLWRKVAATIAIAIALFGIGYAAVTTGFFGLQKHTSEDSAAVKSGFPTVNDDETPKAIEQPADSLTATVMAEPRLYDNVPLEQMLAELSAYYHIDVEYRTDDVRSLRIYYEWEPNYSLDMVVDMLSHFESLSISREGNKLIVESAQEGK